MALTAARTELNVSLVGEDETIRMLEDAKKRMAELEAKTRSLTGATQAQTQAAKAQEAATTSVNGTLGRMAGAISGPLEGIGKLKESISKGIEIFGFLGSAVTGAITAFNFLVDAFDDSDEKAAALEAQMKKNKAETDRLKASTDALSESLARVQAATGRSAATLGGMRAELADLRGDTETALFEREGVAVEQLKTKLGELQAEDTKRVGERKRAVAEIIDAQSKFQSLEAKQQKLLKEARNEEARSISGFNREEQKERAKTLRSEALALGAIVATQRAKYDIAIKNRDAIDQGNEALQEEIKLTKEITNQRLINLGKPDMPEAKAGGGGGGGKKQPDEDPEEIARQEALLQRAEADQIARVVKALYEEQQAREANEAAMLSATKLMRDEVGTTLPALRQQMMRDLAALPSGELFESIRKQLQEQVKAVDAQMGDLRALANIEDADLLAQATDKQVEAVDKLQQSYLNLGEAKAKALEESIKLREELERASIADVITSTTSALQGLSAIQAPALEAISQSVAGLTTQFGKFKDGQTSLASAIVGSAGAIAGAVANKVLGVREEAGVRALFEGAMGIATAFSNPLESAGHFAAAAAFGAVALGKFKSTPRGGDGGGSKAPAKAAASTRDSTMGGGGGTITNVYNLQTGIVDGQSTAMAFRRAEMTARNTGMASAGGW